MSKFSKHKWWIVTALITVPLVAIAAVPNIFQPNTVISSNAVNQNFSALETRITALEAAVAKTSSATMVMNDVPGPLTTTAAPVKTATYMATGANPLLLVVSGSAWTAGAGTTLDVTIQFDGALAGHMTVFVNETGSHRSFPARAITIPTPSAGPHTIGLLTTTPTVTDSSTSSTSPSSSCTDPSDHPRAILSATPATWWVVDSISSLTSMPWPRSSSQRALAVS